MSRNDDSVCKDCPYETDGTCSLTGEDCEKVSFCPLHAQKGN